MNKPHFLLLMAMIQICGMSLSVTESEHRKIEPLQSTSSHGKINQSSWPNQTNKSEKKYEAITIMHKRVQRKPK